MSAIYFAIPTNAGQAKISNALALGVPLKITHMAVGDGNGQPVTPDPAQTKLVREQRRAPLNALFQDPLNPAQLVAQQIIPENEGGWWIHEVGLFDESGTLIAIANAPPTYKPQMSEGSGRTQGINVVLIVSDTSAVELKIDPAVVLATRKYVDDVMKAHKESRDHPAGTKTEKGLLRLATSTEALEGVLETVAVAPKEMKAAMEALLDLVVPIGELRAWTQPTLPNDRFVFVKNQVFDKAALPKLAQVYPSGQIPFDPRGLGLRFWDDSRGMDPGRVLMSEQMDSIASHTHNLLVKATPGGAHTVAGGTGALAAETSILGRNTVNPNDHLLIISGTSGAVDGPIRPFGTTETRGKTIAPAAIMRVK
ncbi:phage tail protein [Aeromonas veronii]|uniref:phage tail protein n=1 Tax=Aeromonas veronii TaxID=654 RepID=UPI0039828EA8